MVPKVTTGAGLRGALNYDFSTKDGAPRAEYIGGTLFGTAREMAAQAGALRALRPDCKKPVFRVSLSLPPTDGQLRADQWLSIVESFKREMGIPETAAWCAVRHTDRDHDHIHFTLLRILPDGSLWNQEHSAKRAIEACQVIEQEFELSSHSRQKTGKARPSRAEIEISNRKGTEMSREHIQMAVDAYFSQLDNVVHSSDFEKDLKGVGIDVEFYAPKGQLKGVSYTYKGVRWPGSRIGRDYSAGLIERGLIFKADETEVDTKVGINTSESEPAGTLITTPGLTLARPEAVARNVINHVPGQWSPLVAAVMAFNQLMLQFFAEGLQGIASALAKFVRSFLRLLGFKVAEPAPATVLDTQETRQARVTVPMPQQFVSNSESGSPVVAERAAVAAASAIEKITKMARMRDVAGIKKEVESTAQAAQLSPEVESLNEEFAKLESDETEMRQELIDRVKDADWLLPERRSLILNNLNTLKGAELLSYKSLVDAIEKNSKRPGYWQGMLNDRHEAYYSAPFGSNDQAEAKRLALYFLEMYTKRQRQRIHLLSDQLQATKKAELLSSVDRLHRFYLSQFDQPIVFDAACARHAAELERSLLEIESKREAEIQSMHSNKVDSNEDGENGDEPAAPGAQP